MVEHVVGNWKTFTFHMATMGDHENIAKHICEYFLKDEAMNAALGWCDINASETTHIVRLALSHGISYYVTETGKNEIVAVNLLMDSTKDGFDFGKLPKSQSPHWAKVAKFVEKLHEKTSNLYHAEMKFERYIDIYMTSVNSNYRGNGIAEEMYRRMMSFLTAEGYQSVQSAFSSPGTRAIINKLGFTELGRLYLTDYVDENGNKVFTKAKEGEFVAEMVKAL